jgi:hypothetical protein
VECGGGGEPSSAPCPLCMSGLLSSSPLEACVSGAPTFGRLLNPNQRGNKLCCDFWVGKTQGTKETLQRSKTNKRKVCGQWAQRPRGVWQAENRGHKDSREAVF